MVWCLSFVLGSLVTARAQDEPDAKQSATRSTKSSTKQSGAAAAKKADTEKAACSRGYDAGRPEPDPQVRAERGFSRRAGRKVPGHGKTEVVAGAACRPARNPAKLTAQAGGVDANIDKDLIRPRCPGDGRQIDRSGQRAGARRSPRKPQLHAPAVRGVHEATTTLLQPIFQAKSIKNQAFLDRLLPHPQRQAHPTAEKPPDPPRPGDDHPGRGRDSRFPADLCRSQIKDPNQTVWVKLWGLEGMVNIIAEGGRLTAQDQILPPRPSPTSSKGTRPPVAGSASRAGSFECHAARLRAQRPQKAAMANAAMACWPTAPPSWKSARKRRVPWARCRSPRRSPSTISVDRPRRRAARRRTRQSDRQPVHRQSRQGEVPDRSLDRTGLSGV